MNKVVKILMERDGMEKQDAIEMVQETRDAILSCDPFDADDVLRCELGLEPDYLFDVLGF
jgi:hypothetical protein